MSRLRGNFKFIDGIQNQGYALLTYDDPTFHEILTNQKIVITEDATFEFKISSYKIRDPKEVAVTSCCSIFDVARACERFNLTPVMYEKSRWAQPINCMDSGIKELYRSNKAFEELFKFNN